MAIPIGIPINSNVRPAFITQTATAERICGCPQAHLLEFDELSPGTPSSGLPHVERWSDYRIKEPVYPPPGAHVRTRRSETGPLLHHKSTARSESCGGCSGKEKRLTSVPGSDACGRSALSKLENRSMALRPRKDNGGAELGAGVARREAIRTLTPTGTRRSVPAICSKPLSSGKLLLPGATPATTRPSRASPLTLTSPSSTLPINRDGPRGGVGSCGVRCPHQAGRQGRVAEANALPLGPDPGPIDGLHFTARMA